MNTSSASESQLLSFSVGDIAFALATDDPTLKLQAEGPLGHFLVEESEPDVRIHAAWCGSCEAAPGERLFDSGSLWQVHRDGQGYWFRFVSRELGPEPYKTARFNGDFTAGEVRLRRGCFRSGQPVYPLEYPLDELLMVNLLAQGRGVEVHGCGVADSDGRGYLFLGQSGAGKSTMARLWTRSPGPSILSDDRIILRMLDGRLWMYGTPWHGEAELASAQRTPVHRIFLLARGERNAIAPLAEADAVARLMACSFVPFHSRSGLDFTLGFLQQVASAVPRVELRFVPDERVVDVVREQTR